MFSPFILGIIASSGEASAPDTTAPSVTGATVEDYGETDTALFITFSEPMNEDPEEISTPFIDLTVDAEEVSLSGHTWVSSTVLRAVTATPVTTGKSCTLDMGAFAVSDLAGNTNEVQADIAVTNNSTRTADETAPVITAATIVDFGATDTALRLTLNETADEDYVLTMLDFGLETVVEFGEEPEIIAVSSPVWLTSTVLRLTTERPILASEDLYLRVAFDAVRDLAGNPNAITDFYHDEMPLIVNNSTRT